MGRIKMSEDAHGVFLEVPAGYITTSCLSEGEVRSELALVRHQLDLYERKMIARAFARAWEPPFSA